MNDQQFFAWIKEKNLNLTLENPWLLQTFRQQTDYILTDESQDTSLLQH